MRLGLGISIIVISLALGCGDEEQPLDLVARLPDTTLPAHGGPWNPRLEGLFGTAEAFRHGVVTTSEPLAAQAGAKVLANGGNAIDAAIAATFMLNVVEPQDSGIGGGGIMMVYLADSKQTVVLNCRELAPKAATADMFANQPSFALRSSSGLAVGVPGTVACAAAALESWGTLSLAQALQPAIEAAEQGIVVSWRLGDEILSARLDNESDPNSLAKPHYDVARAVFRPGGVPVAAGELLVQRDLAETFELIAQGGPEAFYQCGHPAGIADAIIATQLVTRTENPDGVGRMTCEDLESYEVEFLAPISRSYRDYQIVTVGPPSSGGIAILQQLAMFEQFPMGDANAGFGFGQFATLNVMLEAMRLAYADRAKWAGDETCQACFDVPVERLLADGYLSQRAEMIRVGTRRAGISAGEPDGSTTHVTVIDEAGNIAAFTSSIEAAWGTGLMVPGYGFLLNNQLTDFNAVPTFNPDPQAFDPGANDPAPRKRPRTNMAPTMIFLDGEPVAALGSPGGAQIINAVLSVTLNLIDHRLTLQASVDAPRISLTSGADDASANLEDGFGLPVRLALQALGYSFTPVSAIGAVQAIVRIPNSGKQYGAADFRRIGGVAGP